MDEIYGIDIVTNDYGFLFKFAVFTGALIDPLETDTIFDNFRLLYADELDANRARMLLKNLFPEG